MGKRKILLTAALPYANSYVHIGHLVEHFIVDFWNRFQKMRGHECYAVCADDTHGTPVMISARNRKITPEQLIEEVWKEHTEDFKKAQIDYDHYSSTNSAENKKFCEFFFKNMSEKKHIAVKSIEQLFCETDKMFLPDRFVKGTCPKCGAKDQYGDNCDKCGATYSPRDLVDPFCVVCKNKPIIKSSDQLMFQVDHFRDYLIDWLPKHTSKEMANKMKEWFNEPLRDWDISRNGPYFGFSIPGHENKFFYVWVDAPMGYVSTTSEFCKLKNLNFDDFWKDEKKSEVYHFIGKDIVYFHTLFWPALLKTAEFRSPTEVCVHGFLTVNGDKMSKSKGTMVPARTYLKHLDASYLRYYYASKLNSGNDDLDWAEEDFINRVNSDLIGKITNLGSRGAQMLNKQFESTVSDLDTDGKKVVQLAQSKSEEIAKHFEDREFAKAISEIRSLADECNRYFDEKAPWKSAKTDPKATQQVLSSTLNVFRILSIYLKPILPEFTKKVEKLLNEAPYSWSDSQKTLVNCKIGNYEHLATRIDPEKVKALMAESKAMAEANAPTTSAVAERNAGNTSEIEIGDFEKVDLRVAKIIEAEAVPEADKLIRLKVDLGSLGTRQIFAGIKSAYDPATLVGRLTVVVANLKPRKMKFGMSEGMVLAAGTGGSDLFILSPDAGAKPGERVK